MARRQGKTPTRNIRVDSELWYEAAGYAADEGKDMSVLIRAYLTRYVKRQRRLKDTEGHD